MKPTDQTKKETVFLDSFLASPLEIAHPLVYADWLDDQGDPRAEFVRLGDPDLAGPERASPEDRLRELERA
jgi:uncharacterized protein (TIGR02996 family)